MGAPAEQATVRHARTVDGVNLAYIDEEAGSGPPVILLPFHFNHVRYRWLGQASWSRLLAANHRVVHYDSRGQGLSTRALDARPTIEQYMLDLETVRRECGVEKAVLAAYGGFGHVAVQYALANPERVSALALICTSGSFAAWPVRSMLTMIRENWDLYIDVSNAGFGDDDSRRVLNDFCKACAGPVEYLQMVEAFADSDISATLGAVSVPTIVLHSMDQHWLDPEEGRRFAAAIPGAEMVLVDGQTEPNQVATVRAIEQFLDANGLLRSPPPQLDAAAALTERQAEVLQLVARGKTNREVSQLLFLSERTVERHLSDIYAKLGARNRAEAISFALRHG